MKNVKFIKTALIVGSLVVTSSAFADMPSTISSAGITTGAISHVASSLPNTSSKGQLNAFAGVSTQAVSPVELKTVSGDGFWATVKEIFRRAKSHRKNGSCYPNC